jgi:putative endopeptidase
MSTALAPFDVLKPLVGLALVGQLACAAAADGPPPSIPRGMLDLSWVDASVAPGDGFFAYANGKWERATTIPADRSRYGTGGQLEELVERRTYELIRELAGSRAGTGSEERKIGDYYASFMDESSIEANGLKPLRPLIDRIQAINTRDSLAREFGRQLRADVDVFNDTNLYTDRLFGLWVAQDLDSPVRYLPFLLQGGLGMPNRTFYLDASVSMTQIRARYRSHVTAMLKLADVPDARARAERVVALERRIAQVHWSRERTEDVRQGNNHWAAPDFTARAAGLDWEAFFSAAGLDRQRDFVVWQPDALIGIAALVGSEPLATWKDYLIVHALEHHAAYLPKRFVDEHFAFYGRVLDGTPSQRLRWKRAVGATNDALGEAVGKQYVHRYFPASEKARAQAMVQDLVRAFARRIDRLTWMAPQTKIEAKAKLDSLKVHVGYPDKWRDYGELEVVRGDALGNFQRAELFEYRRNVRKLDQPVDRDEWVMTPQTVNAVNLPAMNALNFPAAILQPPFFDPEQTVPMNYGSTGATIGHEISHSFDDEGALFDSTGRLRNWWTAEDFAHFKASSEQLVQQYDSYRPFPDLAVNGRQTLSENIADLAGLVAAYDAYRIALAGQPASVVQGLSGDQQFFVSFAQSWRSKSRESWERQMIITDGHAPPQFRVETVRNVDAWYEAFQVVPGQRRYLAPNDRVRIW